MGVACLHQEQYVWLHGLAPLHAFNHEFAGHLKHSSFWAKKVREEESKRVTITTQMGLFTCDLE